ncbi:MAG: mechanosensitive ion channel [Chitinophagales bacterium]|nr:mechanosensitive ion channel [Bacteroidota bacterium]MBP7398907.1 mechanosensitive ion channel [Chitinophagales bacterium]MBK8683411.1 mechanosensitive ion channel [Bacteroidota bacterium]MBP8754106.1 mechanosensitive ion channel [Chitinophagales bacterium]MBP9190177.1 mechanosensitive ion channel [Chitinophagales bacterium]
MNDINELKTWIIAALVEYTPKFILAIVTLIVGLWLIRFLVKSIDKIMQARDVDASLRPFLRTLMSALLKVMLIISVISMIGVETTSFIAIIGAAGLAIGLALQGSLANFAGGVLILLLKPFKVDDFIEVNNFSGTVKEIKIFYTTILTPENQVVVIPNAQVSNNSIKNYSVEPTRRLDLAFRIGYNVDIDHAKNILQRVVNADERILKDPAPAILVEELADSSVNLKLRVWAVNENYWDLNFAMIEQVKKEFDKENITNPIPQRNVQVFNNK